MNKNFKLGTNLRYTYNSKLWKETENNYRYNLDVLYRGSISDRLVFYYRLRFEHEYVNLFSEQQTTNEDYSTVRNRVKVKYEIHKIHKGYFSAELFRIIEILKAPYFNKVKFYIGDDIKTRIGKIDLSFGYEQEINENYPLSFFYIKSIYTLKL